MWKQSEFGQRDDPDHASSGLSPARPTSAVAERLPCGAGFRLQFEPVATENFDESKLNRVIEDLVDDARDNICGVIIATRCRDWASNNPAPEN